jgi:hypothetical protein
MFTRQATQLQSAIQGQFGNTPTAQDMIQALCNCSQTIEHRGPMDFTFTDPNYLPYPGLTPPPGLAPPISPSGGSSVAPRPAFGQTFINFPPWQPVTWDNLPFVDWPALSSPAGRSGDTGREPGTSPGWSYWPGPMSPWFLSGGGPGGQGPSGMGGSSGMNGSPGGPGSIGAEMASPESFFSGPQYTMNVGGPSFVQNIDAQTIQTHTFATDQVSNTGDTFTFGDVFIGGDTYSEGDTYIGGDTVHNNRTINRRRVTNEGDVTNEGPVTNYGDTHHYGPHLFHGAMGVVLNNVPHQIQRVNVVTDLDLRVLATGALQLRANFRQLAVFSVGAPNQRFVNAQPGENVTVTTDVTWNAADRTFVKTRRAFAVFGRPTAAAVNTDVFASAPAQFDPSLCEIVPDNGEPPEYDPILPPP